MLVIFKVVPLTRLFNSNYTVLWFGTSIQRLLDRLSANVLISCDFPELLAGVDDDPRFHDLL